MAGERGETAEDTGKEKKAKKEILTHHFIRFGMMVFELLTAFGTDTNYKFDDDEKNLELARDMFCFMAFTSLRYSDLENLKKANVFDDHIEVRFSPLPRQHQDRGGEKVL